MSNTNFIISTMAEEEARRAEEEARRAEEEEESRRAYTTKHKEKYKSLRNPLLHQKYKRINNTTRKAKRNRTLSFIMGREAAAQAEATAQAQAALELSILQEQSRQEQLRLQEQSRQLEQLRLEEQARIQEEQARIQEEQARIQEALAEEARYYDYNLENISNQFVMRYQQYDNIHENIRNYLFSPAGKRHVYNLITNSRFLNESDEIINQTLSATAIRFASFLYSQRRIHLIKTVNMGLFKCITLNPGNNDDLGLLELLKQDIILKLQNAELTNENIIFSYDIYLNRVRERAGLFHRDLHVPFDPLEEPFLNYPPNIAFVYNRPDYVSLEYFSQKNKMYFGPELFIENSTRAEIPPSDIRSLISNQISQRVIVQDGTVIMFNNFLSTHATPFAEVLNYRQLGTINTVHPSELHHQFRISNSNASIVQNTENDMRTFIRTYITKIAPELIPLNAILDSYDITDERSNMISRLIPRSNFNLLSVSKHVRGGAVLPSHFDNFIQESLKTNSKRAQKMSKSNDNILNDFKIINPLIKINLDVRYPEIKSKYIKIAKQEEIEFLKSINKNTISTTNITNTRKHSKSKSHSKSSKSKSHSKIKNYNKTKHSLVSNLNNNFYPII